MGPDMVSCHIPLWYHNHLCARIKLQAPFDIMGVHDVTICLVFVHAHHAVFTTHVALQIVEGASGTVRVIFLTKVKDPW